MKKAQLMAGMTLSIVLAGSLTPTAWSKDITTMHHGDRSQPTALSPDCELARNPNIRFFKAPNCTPDETTSPSKWDECHSPDLMYRPWCYDTGSYQQFPKEIIYPKHGRFVDEEREPFLLKGSNPIPFRPN
jgi:hypothetical protein